MATLTRPRYKYDSDEDEDEEDIEEEAEESDDAAEEQKAEASADSSEFMSALSERPVVDDSLLQEQFSIETKPQDPLVRFDPGKQSDDAAVSSEPPGVKETGASVSQATNLDNTVLDSQEPSEKHIQVEQEAAIADEARQPQQQQQSLFANLRQSSEEAAAAVPYANLVLEAPVQSSDDVQVYDSVDADTNADEFVVVDVIHNGQVLALSSDHADQPVAAKVDASSPEQLYPEVTQNDLLDNQSMLFDEGLAQQSAENEAGTVDLAPLCRSKPTVNYLNEHLLDESRFIDNVSRRYSGLYDEPHGSRFFELVRQLLHTKLELARRRARLKQVQDDINQLQKQVHVFSTRVYTSPIAYCGDDRQVSDTVTGKNVEISREAMKGLEAKLTEARDILYKEITDTQFQASMFQLRIENIIDGLLRASPQTHKQEIRDYTQLLFRFEQVTHSDMLEFVLSTGFGSRGSEVVIRLEDLQPETADLRGFRDLCRKWIRQLAAHLMDESEVSFEDRRFLLYETTRCRHIADWGADLIQVQLQDSRDQSASPAPTSSFDEFLGLLSLFFRPALISSTNQFILTEDDFKALWEQFPVFAAVEKLLQAGVSQSVLPMHLSGWKSVFSVLDTILYILNQAMKAVNTASHRGFARLIASAIVRFVQATAGALLKFAGSDHETTTSLYNTYFLRSFMSILWAPNEQLGLWSFLHEMPLDTIADTTSAAIIWTCFTHSTEFPATYKEFSSFKAWNEWMESSNGSHRVRFAQLMAEEHSFHLLLVLTRLAESHTFAQASIVVNEIFLIGFVNQKTRSLHYRHAIPYLSSISEVHPAVIGQLLRLSVQYMAYIGQACTALFKNLALEYWSISSSDCRLLGDLLAKQVEQYEFQMALTAIEGVDFERIIPPIKQRQLCISMINAITEHRKVSKGFFRQSPIAEYLDRLWSVLFRLRLHADDGEPLVEPLATSSPFLDIVTSNIATTQSKKIEFDSMSAFVLFETSKCGSDLKLFNQGNYKKLLEMIVFWKDTPRAIRLMVDLSVRLLGQSQERLQLDFSPVVEAVIAQDASMLSSFMGRFSGTQYRIGTNTKQLSEAICMKLAKLHEYRIVQFNIGDDTSGLGSQAKLQAWRLASFWASELMKIPQWHLSPAVLYCLEQICSTSIRLSQTAQFNLDALLSEFTSKPEMCEIALGPANFWSLRNYPASVIGYIAQSKKTVRVDKEHPFLVYCILLGLAKKQSQAREQIIRTMLQERAPFEQIAKRTSDFAHTHAIYRALGQALYLAQSISSSTEENLVLDEEHLAGVLFFQLFFSLLLETMQFGQNQPYPYGTYFLDISNKKQLVEDLSSKLKLMNKFYKGWITKARRQLASTRSRSLSMKSAKSSAAMDDTDLPSPQVVTSRFHDVAFQTSTLEAQLPLLEKYEALFGATDVWLSQLDMTRIPQFLNRIQQMPLPDRLIAIVSDRVQQNCYAMWLDLVDNVSWKALREKSAAAVLSQIFPSLTLSQGMSFKQQRQIILSNKRAAVDLLALKSQEAKVIRPSPVRHENGTPDFSQVLATADFSRVGMFLDLQALSHAGSQYQSVLDRHRKLDSELLLLLPKLWEMATKRATLTISCIKGPLCSNPATVSFPYLDAVFNSYVEQSIIGNRAMASSLSTVDVATGAVRNTLLLTDVAVQQVIQDGSLALDWLISIGRALLSTAASFPPVASLLNSWVKQLGKVVMQQPLSQARLLPILLQDERFRGIASEFFEPFPRSEGWASFLQQIRSHKMFQGSKSVLPLLRRFDFSRWMQQSIAQRHMNDVMTALLQALLEHDQKAGPNSSVAEDMEVRGILHSSFVLLAGHVATSQPSTLISQLRDIVEAIRTNSCPPDLLQHLSISIMFHSIELDVFQEIVSIIRDCFTKIRLSMMNHTVYENSCAEQAALILHHAFRGLSAETIRGQHAWVFEQLCRSFEPFILPMPSQDGNNMPIPPFDVLHHMTVPTRVIAIFVDTCIFLSGQDSRILQQMWHLYAHTLVLEQPASILRIFNTELARVDWKSWPSSFDFEHIERLKLMAMQIVDGSTLWFLTRFLSSLPWAQIARLNEQEIANMHQEGQVQLSMNAHFYAPLLQMLCFLLIKMPAEEEENMEAVRCFLTFVEDLSIAFCEIDEINFDFILQNLIQLFLYSQIMQASPRNADRRLELVLKLLLQSCRLPTENTANGQSEQAAVDIDMQTHGIACCKLAQLTRFVLHLVAFAAARPKQQAQAPVLVYPQSAVVSFFDNADTCFKYVSLLLDCLATFCAPAAAAGVLPPEPALLATREIVQVFSPTMPFFDPLARFVAKQLRTRPAIAMTMMSQILALVPTPREDLFVASLEACLRAHFDAADDWSLPLALFHPQLDDRQRASFVNACVANNCALLLYAYYAQLVAAVGRSNPISARSLEDAIVGAVLLMKKMPMGEEHYTCNLWILHLSVFNSFMATTKDQYTILVTLTNHVLSFSDHRANIFSKIVDNIQGKQVSMDFVRLCRLFGCYLLRHTAHWSPTDAAATKELQGLLDLLNSKHQQLQQTMQKTQQSRAAVDPSLNAQFAATTKALEYLRDPSKTLLDAPVLLRELVRILFPNNYRFITNTCT